MASNLNDIKENNKTRLARAEAWMQCARALCETLPAAKPRQRSPQNAAFVELDDYAVRFVFWWIALEAMLIQREEKKDAPDKFIDNIVNCNEEMLAKILVRNSKAAMLIIELRQTHEGFWINKPYKKHGEEKSTYANADEWESTFNKEVKRYKNSNTRNKMKILFRRFSVIRNQIFHGANSRAGSRGTTQVKNGEKLLSAFVPFFMEEMKKHPEIDWGLVPFPRYGGRDHNLPPVWIE